jgi:hypothetical protein
MHQHRNLQISNTLRPCGVSNLQMSARHSRRPRQSRQTRGTSHGLEAAADHVQVSEKPRCHQIHSQPIAYNTN